MKNICLVQARLGSSRLSEKILERIEGYGTVLDLLNSRIKKAKKIDEIRYAIPDTPDNDKLYEYMSAKGWGVWRGSHYDLISRYLTTLKSIDTCVVCRVTSDCPLVDPEWIDVCIENFESGLYDYVSTYTPAIKSRFCNGSDIEVFGKSTLQLLSDTFKDKKDREHVTFPLWDGRLRLKHLRIWEDFEFDYSDCRITLDYEEDLQVIRELGSLIDLKTANLEQIVNCYRERNLSNINGFFEFDAGWR